MKFLLSMIITMLLLMIATIFLSASASVVSLDNDSGYSIIRGIYK